MSERPSERDSVKVSKEHREDFTLTLMDYAAERFLYRLSQSRLREQFVLKGAMLFAVRIGERYRPTRDLDLLGLGEATEAAIHAAVREIARTKVDDDGLVFDVHTLEVHAIREDNRYGGIRAMMRAHLGEARIHVQIDVGFGDAITPAATGSAQANVAQVKAISVTGYEPIDGNTSGAPGEANSSWT
jgi:predicted nucleotidyltransferase component of viral defense system